MLLAADIGGTKTKLAVFSPEAGLRATLAEATFPSADYPSLEALVKEFLNQVNLKVERASFGVAGPVVDGQAKITNLPWTIDEGQIKEWLNLSTVRLLNDLDAIAHAVPLLEPGDLYTLNAGRPIPNGTLAVIAPGTGLGEAFLTWDGSRYRSFPSEGGHTDFGPTNGLEIGLLRYLLEKFERVSYERVCSGRGLPNIYAYLRDNRNAEEPAWLAKLLTQVNDPTPVIAQAALAGTSELCTSTLRMFVSILGAEASNLALKVLATGGVYLGGGIPRKILPMLQEGRFMKAFVSKGRFTDLVARMPVYVILNSNAALLGAARRGLEL